MENEPKSEYLEVTSDGVVVRVPLGSQSKDGADVDYSGDRRVPTRGPEGTVLIQKEKKED